MKFGVVVFPGSNCDHDCWYAAFQNLGLDAAMVWHDSATIGGVDAVILPCGFSYGDYLRCGAIAKFSPVMKAVKRFAADGGLVTRVCNGSPGGAGASLISERTRAGIRAAKERGVKSGSPLSEAS